MSGRVGKLFELLEDRDSELVRNEAAGQIGQVVGAGAVSAAVAGARILPLLFSKAEAVRLSAAVAIGAVSKQRVAWELATGVEGSQVSPLGVPLTVQTGLLRFDTFDIDQVVARGRPLLGAGPTEYLVGAQLAKSADDLLLLQRRNILHRIGLDCDDADMRKANELGDVAKLIDEFDVAAPSVKSDASKRLDQLEPASKLVQAAATTKTASTRVKNQLRRAEHASSGLTLASSQRIASSQGSAPLYDDLAYQMFDPAWEVRHGALLGFKALIGASSPGHCFGQLAQEAVSACVEDAALRCMCLLALDHFGDYIDEGVVAPVRDVAAEVLALTSKRMSPAQVVFVCTTLLRLHNSEHWPTRHGTAAGIRHLLDVRPEVVHEMDAMVTVSLMPMLHDTSADVRAVACACISTLLAGTSSALSAADRTRPPIWELVHSTFKGLLVEDDYGICSASQLTLMSSLIDCLGAQDDDSLTRPAWGAVLEALLSFLHAPLASTRSAAASCCRTLVQHAPPLRARYIRHGYSATEARIVEAVSQLCAPLEPVTTPGVSWLTHVCPQLLSVVLHRCSVEEDHRTRDSLMSLWHLLIDDRNVSAAYRASLFADMFPRWMCLLQTQDDDSIDPDAWVPTFSYFYNSTTEAKIEKSELSWEPFTMSDDVRLAIISRVSELSTSCTAAMDRMLASVQRRLSEDGATSLAAVLSNLLLLAMCARETFLTDGMRTRIAELAAPWLSDTRFSGGNFVELDGRLDRMRSTVTRLVDVAVENGLAVEVSGKVHLMTAPDVRRLVEEILPSWYEALDSSAPSTKKQLGLARVLNEMVDEYDLFVVRAAWHTKAAAASAVALSGNLPEKLTPVVKPLMVAVASHASATMQSFLSAGLCSIVVQCVEAGRQATAVKICRNICLHLAENGESHSPDSRRTFRGASFVLRDLCAAFGGALFDKLPSLVQLITSGVAGDEYPAGKRLIRTAILIERVGRHCTVSLWPTLGVSVASCLNDCSLCSPAVGMVVCKRLSMIATVHLDGLMELVLPLLSQRHPTLRSLSNNLHLLDGVLRSGNPRQLLPYTATIAALLVPLLVFKDPELRSAAGALFAEVVKLIPLDEGLPTPREWTGKPTLEEARERGRSIIRGLAGDVHTHDESVIDPDGITLRPYQSEAVHWLLFLGSHGLHGILADDMGLGKTVVALAAIASTTLKHPVDERASLVICPATLVQHWVQEARRYYSTSLPAVALVGRPAARRRLLEARGAAIFVCSYSTMRADRDLLGSVHWHHIVLDEGHIIQNPRSLSYQAAKGLTGHFRTVLTGTPIQNSVTDMWTLFDFLMPGYLGSEHTFRVSTSNLIARSRRAGCADNIRAKAEHRLAELHKAVLPFILRRLKSQVLDDLPPKTIQDFVVDLAPSQRTLYDRFIADLEDVAPTNAKRQPPDTTTRSAGASANHSHHALACMTYLRRVCNHTSLVGGQAGSLLRAIDASPVASKRRRQRHTLLKEGAPDYDLTGSCKLQALAQIIDICGLSEAVGATLDAGSGDGAAAAGGTSMPDVLSPPDMHSSAATPAQACITPTAHRILVFAQSPAMLDAVEMALLKPRFPHLRAVRIDGRTPSRERATIADSFNHDHSISLVLVTTGVGGMGLSLVGADVVVFLDHDWNPMKDLQAMDRAHRLGQKRSVHVYRIIARDTIEEQIMSLQSFKVRVADAVVTQDNASMDRVESVDVLELLAQSTKAGGDGAVRAARVETTIDDVVKEAGTLLDRFSGNDRDVGVYLQQFLP